MRSTPRFVLDNGPDQGCSIEIPPGRTTIGRSESSGIVVLHDTVSSLHAVIEAAGGQVTIHDQRSTNGTRVNGQPAWGYMILNDNDVVHLGAVAMTYRTGCHEGPGPRSVYGFGDVGGPIQTGSGQQQTAGRDIHLGNRYDAGRNQHIGDRYGDVNVDVEGLANDLDELFRGRGLGLMLTWLGLIATIAGFALFATAIFDFFATVQEGFSGADPFADGSTPFDLEVLGVPALPSGFGLAAGGGVVSAIGRAMSRGARRRAEGRARRQQQR
ncbi:MAG: FHA domain-containing protein [bacterium]|nr:FHA domain-containing protein [bacterium]MCP4963944.1 FHA domain-containing protein [bacterium]